jgi:hypothetical protein
MKIGVISDFVRLKYRSPPEIILRKKGMEFRHTL